MSQGIALPGTVVPSGSLTSPAGAQGTGGQGIAGPAGPTAVSANAGNQASLGSDSLIFVPDPTPIITSVRLRSFNSVGNSNFEVDMRSVGTVIASPTNNVPVIDRWAPRKAGTMALSAGQLSGAVQIPGTSYAITRSCLRITLTTQQASLAAGDSYKIYQIVEGPMMRELLFDVHSVSLLVRSSVGNLKFALSLQDSPATKSLVKLCTCGASNTWQVVALPNLPVFPAGNFSSLPGVIGYVLSISLAGGATDIAPALDTWQSGAFASAAGMDNFAGYPVSSTFDVAFIQHEPGPVCSTLMDKPFTQNLDECLRYYQKTYNYGVKAGTIDTTGAQALFPNSGSAFGPVRFLKTMAKIPTMTCFSPQSALINSLRDTNGGIDRAVTGFVGVGDSGFSYIAATGVVGALNQICYAHYTADTGW